MFLHVDSKDCSHWVYAQDDLSLRWAQRSFSWFCHEAAQLFSHHLVFIKSALSLHLVCYKASSPKTEVCLLVAIIKTISV